MKTYFVGLWRKSGRKEFILLAGLALACLCLWAFVAIAEEVGEAEHLKLEERILLSMREADAPGQLRGPPWLAEAARDITAFGGVTAITLIVMFAVSCLLLNRRYRAAVFIVVAVGGGVLLGGILKHSFSRTRPSIVPQLMPETTASFPSGHSMASAVAYITLGALLARGMSRWRDKVFLMGAAFVLSGLIGVSRVALGVHYPSDVLAGWAAGTGWALFCWTLALWLQSRSRAVTPPARESAGTQRE